MVQDVPETNERSKIAHDGYHPDKEHQEVSKGKEKFWKERHGLFCLIFYLQSGSCSFGETPNHAEHKKPNSNIRLPAFEYFNGTFKSDGGDNFYEKYVTSVFELLLCKYAQAYYLTKQVMFRSAISINITDNYMYISVIKSK